MTMRRFLILSGLLVVTAWPVTTVAARAPDATSSTEVPCAPGILVVATGLSADFTTTCTAVRPCSWDFGDGWAGEGETVSHVFAAEGEYTIGARCGDVVLTRTVIITAGSAYRGSGLVPFGVAIAVLVLLGAGVLFFSRRARAGR